MSKELEDRFEHFAIMVREFCQKLKWDLVNSEYIKQLIRASSSIAANYLEASDGLGRADERMKIKIARRESKESLYYLKLVLVYNNNFLENERKKLIDENTQIKNILSAILLKLK